MSVDTATPLGMLSSGVTPSLTNFGSVVLKEFYLGPIRDVLNSKTVLLRLISRNEDSISGKYGVVPLRTSRNEGLGFVQEEGYLPDPGTQGYSKALVPMKWGYARIKFTGQVLQASRNDRGAFAEAADTEIMGAIEDFKHELNRMMFGNGSGRLCSISSTNTYNAATTTQTVINPGGFTNPGNGTQYLRVGMIVAIIREGTGIVYSGTITAVNASAGTVTIAGAANAVQTAAVAGDFIHRASRTGLTLGATTDYPHTSRGNEPMGLAGIGGDTDADTPIWFNYAGGTANTLQGISASGNPAWQAPVIGNASAADPLDLTVMQQMIDLMDRFGDRVPGAALCSHGQRRVYLEQLVPDKQFVNTLEMDGGFRAITYNEIPIIPDKDCTPGRMYWIDFDPLSIYRMSDFFWIDHDGSVLFRVAGGDKDSYQATLAAYMELATSDRHCIGKIQGLAEP